MCPKCSELVDMHDAVVREYCEAVRKLSGVIGDDFMMIYKKAETLRLACQAAQRDIMALAEGSRQSGNLRRERTGSSTHRRDSIGVQGVAREA
jgi:hypothetical protein